MSPMTTPLLEGFPPVIDDDAELLILGSFPSVQSLATHQYYGNPRNAFWPITSELLGFDASVSYRLLPSSSPARAMPAGQKLAVWRAIASS